MSLLPVMHAYHSGLVDDFTLQTRFTSFPFMYICDSKGIIHNESCMHGN